MKLAKRRCKEITKDLLKEQSKMYKEEAREVTKMLRDIIESKKIQLNA
jgi:hypothetical protein